jgi:hypothetical protein
MFGQIHQMLRTSIRIGHQRWRQAVTESVDARAPSQSSPALPAMNRSIRLIIGLAVLSLVCWLVWRSDDTCRSAEPIITLFVGCDGK